MAELRQPVWLTPEEAPPLPSGWRATPTEDACIQLKPGKLFDSKTVLVSGTVPVLNQSETGFLGYHDEEPGVVASPSTPVVTFANHTCAMRLMKQPFSTIQNIFPKIGKPGVTDTVYFYYASLGRVGLSDYKGHHPIFRQAHIPLPPLPVQRRIAGILSAYDELIDNSQRRIKILEAMARALYREWFVSENLPRSLNAQVPRKSRLGELCDLVREPYSERLHSDRPLLDLSRMPQHSLAPGDTGAASELTTSRILFEPGDTLFGAIRCYLHKVSAAHFSGVTNTSVLVLRPKIAAFRSIVAILASDIETIRWADTHSTGTKMPVINGGVFQTMPAPLPSEDLAAAFDEVAGPMMDQIGVLATRIQNLRRTRDLLLPRLLSGQVEVEAA